MTKLLGLVCGWLSFFSLNFKGGLSLSLLRLAWYVEISL